VNQFIIEEEEKEREKKKGGGRGAGCLDNLSWFVFSIRGTIAVMGVMGVYHSHHHNYGCHAMS
jgi:hypothetical protein